MESQDTAVLNKMEQRAEVLVKSLPPGKRVIQTIWTPVPGWRVGADHIVDRACIGRCYSYANYEPSSRQFRVRVSSPNPIVVAQADIALAMREGRYVIRPDDLPLMEIYQCDENDPSQLCMRSLVAGERNGQLGYQPPWLRQLPH